MEEEDEDDQYESNLDYLSELKNLRELMVKENNIYKCHISWCLILQYFNNLIP